MSRDYDYDSCTALLPANDKKAREKTEPTTLLERIRKLEAENKALKEQAEKDEREKCFLARKAALGCFAIAYHEFKDRCSDCKFGVKNCKDILVEDWLLAAKEVCE